MSKHGLEPGVMDITCQCSATELPGQYPSQHLSLVSINKAGIAHNGIFFMNHQFWGKDETK